jgi:hypothetical protein
MSDDHEKTLRVIAEARIVLGKAKQALKESEP